MATNIAVVGSTGLVGQTILKVLAARNFPLGNLLLLASPRSTGKEIEFRGQMLPVAVLKEDSFTGKDIDLALFAAGGDISKTFVPLAREQGVISIDNSSFWRQDPEVPLVVPEVNPHALREHSGIIANPNCSTIQVVVPLKPLHDAFGLRRVVYTTYQSVSGSGYDGLKALEMGLKGKPRDDYPIAGNCIPQIGSFLTNGYTSEEEKMILETKKILATEDLRVTATTVRVPVDYCHSVAIVAEFEKPFDLDQVYTLLGTAPGVIIEDDVSQSLYPLPKNVVGSDQVHVGRIRRDNSTANSLHLWTVADNIRKGAATNAVQIAELLAQE